MDRETVLDRLRQHEKELRGTRHVRLSLFGSVAWGEAGTGSDVELAVELILREVRHRYLR